MLPGILFIFFLSERDLTTYFIYYVCAIPSYKSVTELIDDPRILGHLSRKQFVLVLLGSSLLSESASYK